MEVVDCRVIDDQRLIDLEEAEEKWSEHQKLMERLKADIKASPGSVAVLDSTLRIGPSCDSNGTPLRDVYLLNDNGHYEDRYNFHLRFVQAGSVSTEYGIAERQLTGVEVYNEEGAVTEFIPYHAIKSMTLKLNTIATPREALCTDTN